MANFFDKESYYESDIRELIDNKFEESATLEFKRAGALENNDKSKKEISKDISSFANAAGGIIIYGIAEEDHVASSLSYVDGNRVTKEWIEQVINTRVSRRIPGVKIFPIRFDGKTEQTIYLIKIPESYIAPHMASDNKFYKRYNFQVIPMEEYEVRALYFRSKMAKLEVLMPLADNAPYRYPLPKIRMAHLVVFIRFQIQNVSHVVAEKYKVEIFIPNELVSTPINEEEYVTIDKYYERSRLGYTQYCIQNEKNIFPFDKEIICQCYLNLTELKEQDYEKTSINVNLFFDGGRRSRRYSIKEILDAIEDNANQGLTLGRSDEDF